MNLNPDMPDVMGGAEPGKALPGIAEMEPRRRFKAPNQAVVMAVVCAVSIASLFAMRQWGLRAGMNMAVADQSLQLPDGKENEQKAATYERIMADLQRIEQPLDVALGEFGKSPFMLKAPEVVRTAGMSDEEYERRRTEMERREREARRDRLMVAFQGLKLQSLMAGSVPVARVNGEMVGIGDMVAEYFVITAISRDRVDLEADGETFTLTMQAADLGRQRFAPAPKTPGKQ